MYPGRRKGWKILMRLCRKPVLAEKVIYLVWTVYFISCYPPNSFVKEIGHSTPPQEICPKFVSLGSRNSRMHLVISQCLFHLNLLPFLLPSPPCWETGTPLPIPGSHNGFGRDGHGTKRGLLSELPGKIQDAQLNLQRSNFLFFFIFIFLV